MNTSLFLAISSPSFRTIFPRSIFGVSSQSCCTCNAASTALFTSSSVPFGVLEMISSVAGLIISSHSSPLDAIYIPITYNRCFCKVNPPCFDVISGFPAGLIIKTEYIVNWSFKMKFNKNYD